MAARIHFTQINLHHSKCASAVLARCAAVMHTSKYIFLIQEPWIIKGHIKGLGSCGKLFWAGNTDRPRACIIAKGIDACLLSQFSDGDFVAIRLKIKTTGGIVRDLIIGSVYMSYDLENLPPHENMIKFTTYTRQKGLEILLGCDANSHHLVWGSTDINPRGESLFNFVVGMELHILNRGTEPIFLGSRRQEVIDITICSGGILDLLRGWRVSDEPSGSDHRQIRFTMEQVQSQGLWKRNPRKTNWRGYEEDLRSRLKEAPTRFHTKENLETAADYLNDAIKYSYKMNCPLESKNPSAKAPWWSKELAKLRAEGRRLFNRARNVNTPRSWEEYRKSQRIYKKAIVKAKRKGWRSFCSSIESAPEASRLSKILCKEN
ncbi:uncharacterized protein LOC114939608 [Nylanderia fulva]|uniref:uncharacterized protein LOC114939608 n=1 Tax=Nylanderia fulva TaxID=613905 RepID=UPI0010FAF7F3|nr:uncharacterized protein LOC114939608 [Nylanderia fulva]